MRILFLNPLSELGGAERCLLDLMASMLEARADLNLDLVVSGPGPLVEESAKIGVRVHVVPMPDAVATLGDSAFVGTAVVKRLRLARDVGRAGVGILEYSRQLRRLVRELKPDVIHSNGIKSHLLAVMASRSVPVVWHIRDLIGLRPVVARALQLVSSQASAAIAISELVKQDARTVLDKLPIDVVYDAIDTDAFSPGPGSGAWLDTLAGFESSPSATLRVGLIATYARWKGQDVFIEAMRAIPEASCGRAVRFFIVGGPIYETRGSQFTVAELRALAERAGVAHRIGFVPFQRDIVQVFRSLDVVVHASTKAEPFGRTIAEAMACGRAIILSRVSGAAELVSDSETRMIEPGNSVALAKEIADVLANDALRLRLGAEGRELAERVYSRERLGPEVLAVVNSVCGQDGRGSRTRLIR